MRTMIILLVSAAVAATAQTAGNPLSESTKGLYGIAKNYVTRAADKMPDENYAFQPTPDVRTFGQIIGHVADANYGFCSAVLGEEPPVRGIEKGKTTKTDLVKALADSFAYCDKAYDGMTDAKAAEKVKFFGSERPKLGILNFNNMHDFEHYGNIVTYMRLKGLVPPSSEPRK